MIAIVVSWLAFFFSIVRRMCRYDYIKHSRHLLFCYSKVVLSMFPLAAVVIVSPWRHILHLRK